MPYKSTKQMAYLHAREPEVAARWDKRYGTPENVAAKVGSRSRAARDLAKKR